jgi:hypothetical protein
VRPKSPSSFFSGIGTQDPQENELREIHADISPESRNLPEHCEEKFSSRRERRNGAEVEQKSMIKECHYIMPSGLSCQSPAMRGCPFCYHHSRIRRIGPAPRARTPEPALDFPALLDRKDLPQAINQIVQGLASGRITTHRASLLLHGIKLLQASSSR